MAVLLESTLVAVQRARREEVLHGAGVVIARATAVGCSRGGVTAGGRVESARRWRWASPVLGMGHAGGLHCVGLRLGPHCVYLDCRHGRTCL